MTEAKFNNALRPFSRLAEVEVDCGNEFFVTIRQTAIYNQAYRAKAAKWLREYEAKNKRRSTKRVSVTDAFGVGSITGTANRQADIDYFVDVLLVDWKGLKDDNDKVVPCTKENARNLFSESDEGWTLLQLLVEQSTKDANFVAATEAAGAENTAKE